MFLSLADRDKDAGIVAARRFFELGFAIAATAGTARFLEEQPDPGRHDRRQGRRRRRGRRGRSHLVGQGRSRGQHAARPRPPGRRHAHPPGRDRPRRGLHHHGRRGARGRGRHRRGGRARRPRCARCRSTTPTASSGSRCERSDEPSAAPHPSAASTSPSTLGPLRLPNPIVAASGTFGHGAEVAALCDPRGIGAVTTKSVAVFASEGNPPLRVAEAPGGGMINSVGLPGPGIDAWIARRPPRARSARRARHRVDLGPNGRRLRERGARA